MQTININKIRLKWCGEYSNTIAYYRNDVVRYNGSVYRYLQNNEAKEVGKDINDPEYFEIIAKGSNQLSNIGDILYHDGNVATALPIGAENQFLKVKNGSISWENQEGRLGCSVKSFPKNDILTFSKTSCFLMDNGMIKCCGEGTDGVNGNAIGKHLFIPQTVCIDADNPPLSPFKALYKGHHCFFAITEDGDVYSWGQNAYGELGHGDTVNRCIATRIGFFKENNIKIKEIITGKNGNYHAAQTYFLTETNELYACGYNGYGQLGDGTTVQRQTPVICGSLTNIKKVAVSASQYSSVYAVDSDGYLWSWGLNGQGQLGHGDTTSRTSPTRVSNLERLVDVDTFTSGTTSFLTHTIALLDNGKVFTCGYNNEGQLGLGDNVNRQIFTQISGGDLPNAKNIYAVGHASAILDKDDCLWTWGHNGHGGLGLGDTTNRNGAIKLEAEFQGNIKKVLSLGHSSNFIIVLDRDGNLWGTGYNLYGQLGRGNSFAETNSTFQRFMIATKDINKKIVDITCFGDMAGIGLFLLLSDGQVLACGFNTTYGMLGVQYANLDKIGLLNPVLF